MWNGSCFFYWFLVLLFRAGGSRSFFPVIQLRHKLIFDPGGMPLAVTNEESLPSVSSFPAVDSLRGLWLQSAIFPLASYVFFLRLEEGLVGAERKYNATPYAVGFFFLFFCLHPDAKFYRMPAPVYF